MKTYSAKASEIKKKWFIIDAKNIVLGRLASQVAILLRGKHKPIYTPHIDCGDSVIIVNAKYIHLSGRKSNQNTGKLYYRHTGFPGGIKKITAGKILEGKYPDRVVKMAIKSMLGRNKIGRVHLSKLYVYPDSIHPHEPQTPIPFDIINKNIKNKK